MAVNHLSLRQCRLPFYLNLHFDIYYPKHWGINEATARRRYCNIRVSRGDSYLDMWKKSMERERQSREFQNLVENSVEDDMEKGSDLEQKSDNFFRILEVPPEERDRVHRLQVIDRAAAAISAARALLNEISDQPKSQESNITSSVSTLPSEANYGETGNGVAFTSSSPSSISGTPGPDFWSWIPPAETKTTEEFANLQLERQNASSSNPVNSLMEKERSISFLPIPFESTLGEPNNNPPLPPFQSLMEVEVTHASEEEKINELFSKNAEEIADALSKTGELSTEGVSIDGSRWWTETGIEQRPDGVVCRWTLTRGVSADASLEWENKFWEASDHFGFKELGSEKSGRDAVGNVWREHWKESLWQDGGLVHIEKSADKWGRNGKGDEWHEKWWEHYDASGQAEKWAHKWCTIDFNTPLDAGHAHVWHERWGEKYDGQGSSTKYTDKWAERFEGDGWSKWGDKWDEHFNQYGHGVKQGETWWAGKYGDQWNRTWGEGHNGSGWIHKYGKSSSGEHWDTHVPEQTWYERYPHYGFHHCMENSVQLREVPVPPSEP